MNITKEELCKILGLPPEATDDQIRTALKAGAQAIEEIAGERTKAEAAEADAKTKVEAAQAEANEAKGECEKAKTDLANERKAHVGILLDNAIADGRISVAGRAAWEKRLNDDFAAGKVALANEKPLKRESAVAGQEREKRNNLDLVSLANERMAKHPGMDYITAFSQVMAEHPEVK